MFWVGVCGWHPLQRSKPRMPGFDSLRRKLLRRARSNLSGTLASCACVCVCVCACLCLCLCLCMLVSVLVSVSVSVLVSVLVSVSVPVFVSVLVSVYARVWWKRGVFVCGWCAPSFVSIDLSLLSPCSHLPPPPTHTHAHALRSFTLAVKPCRM